MRDDICTIPISEVFEPKDGCPICRLRDSLEKRIVEYITGAAMMEPDVRIETNKKGFCARHFKDMMSQRNRLSVALTIDTHLLYIQNEIASVSKKGFTKKQLEQIKEINNGCFVCDKVEWGLNHMMVTLFKLWSTQPEFRKLYNEQTCLCFDHYTRLMTEGQKQLNKKLYPDFVVDTTTLMRKYLDEVKKDTSHYCSMYDYRNVGGDWGNAKDSIERSVWFLTSREAKEDDKKD